MDGAITVRGMTPVWDNLVRDRLRHRLRTATVYPYSVISGTCVLVDEHNPPKPDVIVYDKCGRDVFSLECIPVEKVALVVEVVSPGSRQDDRIRKPGMFAEARVPWFWRVERGQDGLPEVHELWLHHDMGMYVPAPAHPVHTGTLKTDVPFPVEVDLAGLVEPRAGAYGTMGA